MSDFLRLPAMRYQPTEALRPCPRNARTHSRRQIAQIADSIRRFGFTNPILVSDDGEVVAGHGRLMAARDLGLTEVPTLLLSHLGPVERRAYVLADNKLALEAGWDQDLLARELQGLIDLDFDVTVTGFSVAELDFIIDAAAERSTDPKPEDEPAKLNHGPAITRPGDLWLLGGHRLIAADARDETAIAKVLEGRSADLIFTDPPYNVAIDGNVCGLGSVRHREFAFASGDMSPAEFTAFLEGALGVAARNCRDGAIAFVCMDWRHMGELLAAGRGVFSELKNLCVWNKTNGGMGTFYRSKHELIFVFKVGTAPHTNTFGLGESGRYRTNVWDYAGVNAPGSDRKETLAMHPTVKPVALVADAIRDCTRRGDIVLDSFGGSGSTLIAAERCGRLARLVEIDPLYCDTIIRRWQKITGKTAILAETGERFDCREAAPSAGPELAEAMSASPRRRGGTPGRSPAT